MYCRKMRKLVEIILIRIVALWRRMATEILTNTGWGNGLVAAGTKQLPEQMLTIGRRGRNFNNNI